MKTSFYIFYLLKLLYLHIWQHRVQHFILLILIVLHMKQFAEKTNIYEVKQIWRHMHCNKAVFKNSSLI